MNLPSEYQIISFVFCFRCRSWRFKTYY